MRNLFKKIISGILLGAILVTSTGFLKQVEAAETTTTIADSNITIVDSIDNVQYPKTNTSYAVKNTMSTQAFSINTSTALKMYFSWDTSMTSKMTVWISTDYSGINVIGQKYSLNSPGQSLVTMLDSGTYYLCYLPTLAQNNDYAAVNYAILGEKVFTTESVSRSSKTKPNELKISTSSNTNLNYGFLSETSPIDYYTFGVSESSDVTFDFNFKAYEGISLNSAILKVFNYETDALIASQKINPTTASSNNLNITLDKGGYYVTMSGATTATTLSAIIGSQDDQTDDTDGSVRDSASPIGVTYVDFIENFQYPETSKYTTVSGNVGVKSFTLTKPTILKIYMTWDTAAFRSATVWLSRDEGGYDIIEAEKTLSKTTSYLFHLLDPGKYYINYKMTGTSNSVKSETGICVIGQTATTNEGKNYASSYNNPLTLTPNKIYKGFLSVTAPVDYYKLTLDQKSMVTFTYDFAQINNGNPGATINIYNSNNVLLRKQNYSATGAEYNKIQLLLEKGMYYISMTGAETTTILKASTVSREISVKKTISNKKVKLSLSFAFSPAEMKVVKGYVYDDFVTDNLTWSKATTLTSKSYTVSSTGYYTFRIKDTNGNYFLKRVKVTTIK